MQTLYGIKITDRVTVQPFIPRGFAAFFDGEQVTEVVATGEQAVRRARDWLQERAQQREWERKDAAEREARNQEVVDDQFLRDLADRIGCSDSDMFELIEVIKRRMA